jgi:hypothetical protein
MNFYKATVALPLAAMALTSCKVPESDSSESAPPAEETISVATACVKIKPLVVQAGKLLSPGPKGPDFTERIKPLLDDIDGIANSVETEEGRAKILDMTQAWDKFIAAIEAGDAANDSEINALDEMSKTTTSLGNYCKKALLK